MSASLYLFLILCIAGGISGCSSTTEQRGSSDANTTPVINTDTGAILKSLTLTADKTTLNKDTNTTVTVIATFSDTTTQDVTDQVQWNITPKESLHITKHTLQTLQDGNITLQATLGAIDSNILHVNVFWEINGHRLPPEPDPKVNNATLLGIDVNNNNVRDDVERWIYEKYKEKHPIHIDIAMQAARGYKLVLQHPERAKEIRKSVNAIITCEGYYMVYAKYFDEPILIKERIDNIVEYIYFNTKERKNTYIQYDTLLSGNTYPTANISISMKSYCDFNTSKYEE